MKFAVSIALVVLLLGMPLGCVLAGYHPLHPCCPTKSTSSKCPYDTLDNAKGANTVAVANVPLAVTIAIAAPTQDILRDLLPEVAEARQDLCIVNRILRI